MIFARLAIVEFESPEVAIPGGALNGEKVAVEMIAFPTGAQNQNSTSHSYFAIATVQLPTDAIVDGVLTINEEMRSSCELMIEGVANLCAVSYGCVRKIYSNFMPYSLIPENELDKRSLETLVEYPRLMMQRFDLPFIGIDPQRCISACLDRLGGMSIMAECAGNSTSQGKFKECMRLFELAFKRASEIVETPLRLFLESGDLGYTKTEVRHWLRYRHRSLHADLKKQSSFAREHDVQHFIGRLQQAALDVLYNKATWHDASSDRRHLWIPRIALLPDNGLRAINGYPGGAPMKAMDCFLVWPLGIDTGTFSKPPGWWMPEPTSQDSTLPPSAGQTS